MKKLILLNILFILLFFLTGCWNAMELNSLGIVLVMGLDFEDDKLILTAEVIEPAPANKKASMKKEGAVIYVQGKGDNIFDAFRDITLKFDRKLFIAHNKVIILGEEFVKEDLIADIDLLVRDHEQRETAYLLVAKGKKAYEVMGIASGIEEIPGNYILKLVENFKYNPKVIKINIAEYLRHFYDVGQQPVLGVIEEKGKSKINKISKSDELGESQLSVIGAAAFNKENLVGYLDAVETKSFNTIMGKVNRGIITFPITNIQEEASSKNALENAIISSIQPKIKMSTVDIIKMKVKKDVEVVDGDIVLKSNIKLRCSLEEFTGDIDIAKEENIREIEKACSREIERELKDTVTKVQNEFEVDIFGFGSAFHRKYPEEWKKIKYNWDDFFSKAEYQIEVETDIIKTGLINTQIRKIKGR